MIHRMLQLICGLLLLTGCSPSKEAKRPIVDLRSLPLMFSPTPDSYKSTPYIALAVQLQAMGSNDACQALLATLQSIPSTNDWSWQYSQEMAVLCRMLFANVWRAAALGEPSYLPGGPWPLDPIEIVDGVPFVIVTGYTLGGVPESGINYLHYCMREGEWNTNRFEVRTKNEKYLAVVKLLLSPKWKQPLDSDEREYLSKQIE